MADTTPDAAKDAARAAAKIPAGILDVLVKPASLSADALAAVAKGGLNLGSVFQAAGSELNNFTAIGGLAGKGLKILGEYAQESVDAMRNFSKVGAGFSGDAIGMRASIAQTNMSLEQYGKFLSANTALLNGMGGTVSQGAKTFNAFSEAFFAATGKTKGELGTFGDQLRNLGMTSEEINGILALELTSRRFTNMQDAVNREAALESAKALAEEMDKTAKLTGKSREEQQKSLAALERDGKYQAAIRLEMMNGNKFAAEAMTSAMAKVEKFGPGVQALTKDLVGYGTATKDTAATLSALGPAGTQLQNAINMAKTARTEEQKQAAAKAVADAEMAVQARLNSRDFNEMARVGIKGATDIANQTTTLTAGMDKIAAEQGLNLNLESDRRKAAQALNEQATKEQTAAKTPAKPGAEDQGKATTQAVIQFESSLQKASAAINDQFIKKLNDDIAPAMAEFTKKMQDTSQDVFNRRVADGYGALKKAFNVKETEPVDPAVQAREAAQIRAKGEQAANEAREKAKAAGLPEASQESRARIAREQAERAERERIQRERPPVTTNPLSSARGGSENDPVFVRPVNGPISTPTPTTEGTPRPQRAFGSLEMAGKMFEDWGKGTMVELHGLESVMRPQDLSNVIESAMGGVRKTMPKIDVSEAGKSIEMPKFEMPKFEMPGMDLSKIDLSKIGESITTSLSSVTGGKATTIRGQIPGYQNVEPEADIDQLTQLKDSLIKQTDSIAEQTQSMLAVKKDFLDTELIQIGEELSALNDERVIQSMREDGIQDGIDKLKAQKDIYENNQKYDERDLAESTEELAMLRNRIDNSQSETEILELQKQIEAEEEINVSLQKRIAERNQNILNTNADIALKEQELQDLREEIADTEVAIQDKREQLLDSVTSLNDQETAPIEQEDTEFGDLEGAMKRASNQMYPDTEFGDLDGAIKRASNQIPDTEFGDLDGAMKRASENMYPDTEFGDLEGAMERQKNKTQTVAGKDPFARMLDKFMGPMAEPGKALAPAEAAKTSVTTQQEAVTKAAAEKAKASQTSPTESKDSTTTKPTSGSKEATLSDVVKSLETLNKQVGLLNGEMSKLPNLMEKAVSATKSLNGNLNARVT